MFRLWMISQSNHKLAVVEIADLTFDLESHLLAAWGLN